METATTGQSHENMNLLKRNSMITDFVITVGFILCAAFASEINPLVLSLLMLSAVLFACTRNELMKLHSMYADTLRAIYFTAVANAVSYVCGVSPLLSIIPALIALIFSKDARAAFIIPVSVSLCFVILLFPLDNIFFWTLWATCCAGCWVIQMVVTRHVEALNEQSTLSGNFQSSALQYATFVDKISNEDYPTNSPFATGDSLGKSLYDMSLKFKKASEVEKLHSWQMGGLNDIGSILRSTSDITSNYNKLISFLVNYLGSNQGGLFTINSENPADTFVELKACYAYEKHKILQKKQGLEDGLIGQCILEKELVYLEQLPDNYVHITSGLGLATPTSLVIVPLKNGEQVVGVIEIASFKKVEQHERDFLEKAAEIIGAAIQSFQSGMYTKKMLIESQQLAEELKSQQEEVRQNLEELEATQEHLTREAKEREKLEAELNKSREFLNLVLDSVPIPVFVKDREHKMILLNKAVCDLNNMTKDQMLGKSDYDFFTKDEADVFWNFEEKIFNTKVGAEKVEHAVRNGRETYTIDKKLVVTTDDGENFMVGINIDVTYAKMMEEQLKDEAKMLVRTRRDIKRLADVIAKEIGCPLAELKSLTRNVSQYQSATGHDDQGAWEEVECKIDRMQSLVNAIAHYYQLGTQSTGSGHFQTRKLIEEVIALCTKGGNISFDLDRSLPVIRFDKQQMFEVFSALIKNAIEHLNKSTGNVSVRANRSDKLVQFAIADDGPGIDNQKQEQIFDVFETLKLTNGKFFMGSGLTFAKKIIEENGGSLWVEPNGNRGSKFIFNLPADVLVNT
jgi:PAS domain S-box-containing protein